MNVTRKLMVLFMVILLGCTPQPPPAFQDVLGFYRGGYGGASEVFEIRSDGTFTQILTVGAATLYTNNGTWRINGKQVVFDGVFRAMPMAVNPKAQHPGRKIHNLAGLWVSGSDGRRAISFDVDNGYQIQKVIEKPDPKKP